jgi:uncharacterized protein YecA (UPF0149 family)
MSEAKLAAIIPVLNGLGLTIDKISPNQLERLEKLSEKFDDVSEITPELTREIMNIFGIKVNEPRVPRVQKNKLGRNELCSCQSGKKYKKCCDKL